MSLSISKHHLKDLYFIAETTMQNGAMHIYIRPCKRHLNRSTYRRILNREELVVRSIALQNLMAKECLEIHEKWIPANQKVRFFEESDKKGEGAVERMGVCYREIFPVVGKFNRHNYARVKETHSDAAWNFSKDNSGCCTIL